MPPREPYHLARRPITLPPSLAHSLCRSALPCSSRPPISAGQVSSPIELTARRADRKEGGRDRVERCVHGQVRAAQEEERQRSNGHAQERRRAVVVPAPVRAARQGAARAVLHRAPLRRHACVLAPLLLIPEAVNAYVLISSITRGDSIGGEAAPVVSFLHLVDIVSASFYMKRFVEPNHIHLL